MELNQENKLKNFLKVVGGNIRAERKKVKMTQGDLAFNARIDLNTISNIENGKSPSRIDTIYKIANVFMIEPSRLLETSKIYYDDIMYIKSQLNKINDKLNKFL